MIDGTSVSIVRDLDAAYPRDYYVATEDREGKLQHDRAGVAISAAEGKLLLSHSHNLVLFQDKGRNKMFLHPEPRLYESHSLVFLNGIVDAWRLGRFPYKWLT